MIAAQKMDIWLLHTPLEHCNTAISVPVYDISYDIQFIRTGKVNTIEMEQEGIQWITVEIGSYVGQFFILKQSV